MQQSECRFPAEWEPQSAVLIAWPHADTDWAERLDAVERIYVALATAVSRFQALVVCVRDAALGQRVRSLLDTAGADASRLRLIEVEYHDTWLRDSGPITLRCGEGFTLLDFRFTGWGGKFEADADDRLVAALLKAGLFRDDVAHRRIDFALEGGAVETDGRGTLLTTWLCLTQRHPQLDRAQLAAALSENLRQQRVLMLENGELEGDDTDAHIDTLARFADAGSIVYQACDDPDDPHFEGLGRMAAELAGLRTADSAPYRLHPLRPVVDAGRRLAASYANFLIINGAVLMPAYGDPADAEAAAVLREAFPDREIVPVPCRDLIWQNGSLHCITMQLPEGVVDV